MLSEAIYCYQFATTLLQNVFVNFNHISTRGYRFNESNCIFVARSSLFRISLAPLSCLQTDFSLPKIVKSVSNVYGFSSVKQIISLGVDLDSFARIISIKSVTKLTMQITKTFWCNKYVLVNHVFCISRNYK